MSKSTWVVLVRLVVLQERQVRLLTCKVELHTPPHAMSITCRTVKYRGGLRMRLPVGSCTRTYVDLFHVIKGYSKAVITVVVTTQ